jgi:hypothetical protein
MPSRHVRRVRRAIGTTSERPLSKEQVLGVYLRWRPSAMGRHRRNYSLSSSGTLPPFSASFIMTCLCSQMFIDAESFISPV